MKLKSFIFTGLITGILIFTLNKSWKVGSLQIPAIGKFLSPQQGFWQNAEPLTEDYSQDLKFPSLKGKVDVYLDERLVPHVFAEQENDAYFVQGYLHAKFRLWQMELQTFSAGGRLSEIMGVGMLERDRQMRRLGMVYSAENTLKIIEKDPVMKAVNDAYTAGVNAYIENLPENKLPVEYKLLGYRPENWSNLKTVLFMKYMSYDLAGFDEDFEMTNAKNYFDKERFDLLFPIIQDSLDPVIPDGTQIEKQGVFPVIPGDVDSVYLKREEIEVSEQEKPNRENGSNNWAVSGRKTKSGAPILSNDLHLTMNLPSIWYEVQITAPTVNVYGVSFPGVPGVIVGFNDSCSFGFTNGGRDVRDYYEITFKDESRKEYRYNGEWHQTIWRPEVIKINGSPDFTDSVSYVKLGDDLCPVMYDNKFSGSKISNNKYYAVRWKGNDPSNDLKAFYLLNHSKNYDDFNEAVLELKTPGQNVIFATKSGDIAIKTQGEWPAKWKEQGDFVMPGFDSSYLWQAMIPQDEVPFQYNPERGFVSSANQKPEDDKTYPYYLGRNYPVWRGKEINRRLETMENITTEDMLKLQTDNYNIVAEVIRPLILANINVSDLSPDEKKYYELLKNWDLRNDAGSQGATVFELFWMNFYKTIYDDEYKDAPKVIKYPDETSLIDGLLSDSGFIFIDDITTDQKETLTDRVTTAFKITSEQLNKHESKGRLEWDKFKGTQINHLSRLVPFGRYNIPIGGSKHNINATETIHGPSWRMVVNLTQETEAYGVYPGGQSGNPGSRFYDDFIDYWAEGKYYPLWLMTADEQNDSRVKWKMSFTK
ncbi:MAG: penicillin acylase family protein [Ignavibacteriae bacterium]|nr:penicillin acylase family protein [Ignavibacteriota bacterium]